MENNPMMNKKKLLLIGAGVLAIIILAVMIFSSLGNKKTNTSTNQTATTVGQQVNNSNSPAMPNANDKFREEVPQDVKVPGMNEVLTEAQKTQIAVPSIVTPAAPGAESSFRSFAIRGEGGKFIPAEVIARQNDIVHVTFTAVDKDYDIVFPSYGMRQVAKKGQTKILEFQAVSEGSFTYYCESCGGANGPTKGKVIVVK